MDALFAKKQSYVLFEAYFQDEGHLHANCLFYIFSLCLKCLFVQTLTRGIRMHIPIQVGVQNRHIIG